MQSVIGSTSHKTGPHSISKLHVSDTGSPAVWETDSASPVVDHHIHIWTNPKNCKTKPNVFGMYLLKQSTIEAFDPILLLHNVSQILGIRAQLARHMEFTASNYVHFEVK